jgi:hypothetical protein
MSVRSNIIVDLLEARGSSDRIDWRVIERLLIDHLRSLRIPLADGGGTVFVEIVLGVDETRWLSVEALARHLAVGLEQ